MTDRDPAGRQELPPEGQRLVKELWRTSTRAKLERRRQRTDRAIERSAVPFVLSMAAIEIVLGIGGVIAGAVAALRDGGIAFHIAVGCAVASFFISYAHEVLILGPWRFDSPIRVACLTLAAIGLLLALGTVHPFLYLLAIVLIPAYFLTH